MHLLFNRMLSSMMQNINGTAIYMNKYTGYKFVEACFALSSMEGRLMISIHNIEI